MIYKYAHPEYFKDWEKPDFNQIKEPIILWGAGMAGGAADHCMKKMGVEYVAFCDTAKDKWGIRYCGHEVISPDELQKRYPTAVVIITSIYYDSIYGMARERGYTEIYDCHSLFMDVDFSGYDFWATKEYIIRIIEQCLVGVREQKTSRGRVDQIYLGITTKCSLRCRDCSMFIPYVASPCHYDSNDIMADLNKVLNSLQHVRTVYFFGGEPLLHPHLGNMVHSLKDENRIDRISIITNGTILPGEDVLRAMRDEKRFWVRISDYGILSRKKNELIKILEQYGIRYEVTNYTFWLSPSKIGKSDDNEEQLAEKFRLCTLGHDMILMNRRGYLCNTGSAVCNMGALPESLRNYIDLLDDHDFTQKLNSFIKRLGTGEYLDACRYCSGSPCIHFEGKVPVAIQAKELLKFPSLTKQIDGMEPENG